MEHPLVADLRRCRLLAVYGTLMIGERNHEPFLGDCRHVAAGTIGGRIVEVPAASALHYPYPALLRGDGRVSVDVFEITDPATLASVDELEFEVDDAGEAEYDRQITSVHTGAATDLDAWCYVYRWRAHPSWRAIPTGDWRLR